MADSTELFRRTREAPRGAAAWLDAPSPPEADEGSAGVYGYLRGARERALMLELRFRDGGRLALPYSWLGASCYDPSLGVLLTFAGDRTHLVLIRGPNLDRPLAEGVSLYERGLLRHRVTFVREMTPQEVDRAGEGEVAVERILRATLRADQDPMTVSWARPFLALVGTPDGAC